ncbi:MAG: DNA-directed RNA polymerase subunit B, Rpo2 [Candidatus Methanohalarchaeum thermophilum]|uniref:DNA-directed RNA polymerase n=1 Tax=Methanohalarchaeum thermophilum TaxID=1903181 RepID=A0A1Q6DS00_METT1|nr:MAG: DNA-directed RNA polymerase subunit B, Rpo2 [Candidatus Methanohalarchaeum thermophilum]
MNREEVTKSYLEGKDIASHHIESFNDFLDKGLQKVIDEHGTIETDIEEDEIENYEIKLGEIRVGKPIVREADGSTSELYPTEARLRNLTYSAPLELEMIPIRNGNEEKAEWVEIGILPIMLRSKYCNLNDLDREELIRNGEDPKDPGGYFIINGSERVLVTLEDLAPNRIMVEYNDRYGDQIEVAKTFSKREGYRALIIVERGRDGLLEVSFPGLSGRINFITLMRALGLESDKEISDSVSDDTEIMKYMFENLEEAEVESQEEAIEKIGNRVAAGQAKEYRNQRANYVLEHYLLPHLGNDEEDRILKAHYLGRMAESCFELALGRREEGDKDHYSNKKLKLSGDLMEDLFRVSFNRLTKDVKYQLERANTRNRELSVKTSVRPDVLSQRLQSAMATGEWVGGRTGVAQLLDRTDHMASLAHLRRVVSPLSRSQPHFEARDLHPTHWGRICPSETPEGPNCGLVKNYAMAVELTKGVEDSQEIEETLYKFGVNNIERV